MNFRYPIFLDLAGKRCLVVGEGPEIAGKVSGLVSAGAEVTYLNPNAVPVIEELATLGLVRWEQRVFHTGDLAGFFLAITDLDDNTLVFREAEERGVLCNAADDPANCRFSFGSVHHQGDLTIAISTNGKCPALAVRLRQRFENDFGPEYGELIELLGKLRQEISERLPDFSTRRDLWYRLVDSDALQQLREDQKEAASRTLRAILEETASSIL